MLTCNSNFLFLSKDLFADVTMDKNLDFHPRIPFL